MDQNVVTEQLTALPTTRGYQQEMLEESLERNIIIALDTGSGKTHIAVLRMKIEAEREPRKISWFLAPTVALCEQQRNVINMALPVSVGLISGSLEPDQWKNAGLWRKVLETHRVMVSTPQVLLDALRHGYIVLGKDISLLIFDEAHHAVDNDPYNRIMQEFYFRTPLSSSGTKGEITRPAILGLTASPIFGGNVVRAFQIIEGNLDSVIRAPQIHRNELANHVHRPDFKHILYPPHDLVDMPFSTNLAALEAVLCTLEIVDDPYVKALQARLRKLPQHSDDYRRVDQQLSKTIFSENTFTHKGLRDFARSAQYICLELGPWAADWYVEKVIEQATLAMNPFSRTFPTWQDKEKAYLSSIIKRVTIAPVSYYPDDIVDDSSPKVQALIDCLLAEKEATEALDESYSGLIFVQRRDSVIALAEVLSRHPQTADIFRVGCLIGTSESRKRHSFLDITRTLLSQGQEDTLADFKNGAKNVIVSTSVAEEGIDIQACGSVIRWDPPQNMASWAQSRGRARRKRSTFTLMFEDGGVHQKDVAEWERLEMEMVALYNNNERHMMKPVEENETDEWKDVEDEELEYRVEETGALLTLHSAVAHLEHFCAVIPHNVHVDNRPIFEIDPPELPEGWHSFDNRSTSITRPYPGPFGAKVTLPRSTMLPDHLRVYTTKREYRTKISAYRHVAFACYKALHDTADESAKLLNDHLLPLTSVVEPHLEEDVKALLKDVEKRASTASVSLQMDPWRPKPEEAVVWWCSELAIEGLPTMRVFTRVLLTPWTFDEAPYLFRPGREPVKIALNSPGKPELDEKIIAEARQYTRRLFWVLNGNRMQWENLDFGYLLLPSDPADKKWDLRRSWLQEVNASLKRPDLDQYFANAELFGREFLYPDDLTIVRNGIQFAKSFSFVRWRFDVISEEDEQRMREMYSHFSQLDITYPLLEVHRIPSRTNFLLPISPTSNSTSQPKTLFLLPRFASVTLCSPADIEYASLLPSILRSLAMSSTVNSLRENLLARSSLATVPTALLTTAITAPVSQELHNYQRLETLGDTVLKFVVGIQLLAQYPLWHEGYLSRKKDHAVSNARLAKEALNKELYNWIIRDRLLGKKWRPHYFTLITSAAADVAAGKEIPVEKATSAKKPAKGEQLSMKVLADVCESLIGASYLHGGFDLGVQCAQMFGMGLLWDRLPVRIETMLGRVRQDYDELPSQVKCVEQMIGYEFNHKLLLVEALTHASHEADLHTVSYERMEFLGDSVLDMIVTDYLYHAPGKEYTPGHMFHRKSATVNAHILAFICLRTSLKVHAVMPQTEEHGQVSLTPDDQLVYLWQCLLHSSHRILDDQDKTFARYKRGYRDIENALQNGTIFPWADLIRLQAPKFLSDMVESVLGAVYLDSNGSLDAARDVLQTLGIMQLLERIVREDVDVLHPVSRLSLWSQKLDKKLKYDYLKEKGNVTCKIMIDGKEEARATEIYAGHASQEHAKYTAAEKAIASFNLHDENVKRLLTQKKVKTKRTD